METNKPKYVVLEHLELPNRGFRFWSTNSDNNTHSFNGELWYKEILFTDDTDEAIATSQIINKEALPTSFELMEYHRKQIQKRYESS